MRIDLVGTGCPVLPGVSVGVQRGREVVDARPAEGSDLHWQVELRLLPGPDFRGHFVQGRPGGRFLYLVWSTDPDGMFRRAKLMLDGVPAEVLTAAADSVLLGRFGLTMPDGSPLCAAVRPPAIVWSLP